MPILLLCTIGNALKYHPSKKSVHLTTQFCLNRTPHSPAIHLPSAVVGAHKPRPRSTPARSPLPGVSSAPRLCAKRQPYSVETLLRLAPLCCTVRYDMTNNKTCTHRLRKEYRNIQRDAPPHITARPLPSNLLKWYFVLEGPPGTPYEGGLYLGRLQFTDQYPYKPPAVYMCTPQGRFRCDVKLCLSMSDFHPESWNPLWSVGSVLTGLLSFMLGVEDTVGSINTADDEKRALARSSHAWNRRDATFRELFPDFIRDVPPVLPRSATSSRKSSTPSRRNRNIDNEEGESLVSLLAWLTVFFAVIFAVFHFITRSA